MAHHWRDSRAHQAPFYARGLSEISAVSENAPGAHRDVPRNGDVPRTGAPAVVHTGGSGNAAIVSRTALLSNHPPLMVISSLPNVN